MNTRFFPPRLGIDFTSSLWENIRSTEGAMTNIQRVGRWGILGRTRHEADRDGYMTFDDEIASAQPIQIKSKEDVIGQMNLIHSLPLPGWHAPLFAHVEGFLYLRRPEGVWKLKCPSKPNQSTLLHLPSLDSANSASIHVGSPARESGKWHRLVGEPATPRQMDEWRKSPSGVDTDEIGGVLLNPPKIEGERLIFEVGDGFSSPPVLTYGGCKWIFGLGQDGRRLAFDASDVEWVNEAVADGALILRFTSRFFSSFDVAVAASY